MTETTEVTEATETAEETEATEETEIKEAAANGVIISKKTDMKLSVPERRLHFRDIRLR